jgi:hypothetical protein
MAPAKTPAPPEPEQRQKTSTRQMRIEFKDGRDSEVIVADSPAVVFKLTRLKPQINDDLQEGFVAIWLGAGAPGLNGSKLTTAGALDLTEKWLDADVASLEDVSDTRPPTNRSRRRR